MPSNDPGQPSLFDDIPYRKPVAQWTPQQRQRARQQAQLDAGLHPLTVILPANQALRLHPQAAPAGDPKAPGLRCGSCTWRRMVHWHNRDWPKCLYSLGGDPAHPRLVDAVRATGSRISHGTATDVRTWWPACADFQPRTESSPTQGVSTQVGCPFCTQTYPVSPDDPDSAYDILLGHVRFAHPRENQDPAVLLPKIRAL